MKILLKQWWLLFRESIDQKQIKIGGNSLYLNNKFESSLKHFVDLIESTQTFCAW